MFSFVQQWLAQGAVTATQRGSLIDRPKPELGERNGRPRGKDEQTRSWRSGHNHNKSPRQSTLRRAGGEPLGKPAVGDEYITQGGDRASGRPSRLAPPGRRTGRNSGLSRCSAAVIPLILRCYRRCYFAVISAEFGKNQNAINPLSGRPAKKSRITAKGGLIPARRPGCRLAAHRATGWRT
jgi:hypothetical protein